MALDGQKGCAEKNNRDEPVEGEAIGRPCHRGIREFCLSRGARVFMRQARRRSCSPCCRPALREPGCRTLLQIARAVVGLDRTGMPSCPGAANETSPPRPSFPEGSILPPPLGQIGVPFRRPGRVRPPAARRTLTVTGGSVPDRDRQLSTWSRSTARLSHKYTRAARQAKLADAAMARACLAVLDFSPVNGHWNFYVEARLGWTDCEPWASATNLSLHARLGRTASPKDWSDRSDANASTMWSSWARRTYAGFCKPMPTITTIWERTARWTKMRHSRARFSVPEASRHSHSSADCITTTCESEFSVHTGADFVFALLQWDAHAPGVAQGRPARTSRRAIWNHRHHTNLVRLAS